MPLIWTKGSPERFLSLGNTIEDQLYKSLASAMVMIAAQGAITARAYTAERGRPTSRGAGRVDSGDMANAIRHEVEFQANQIIARFGFVGEQAQYFLYQTVTGFEHWLSADFIEPTFALRDAKIKAEPEVVAAVTAAIRSVKL